MVLLCKSFALLCFILLLVPGVMCFLPISSSIIQASTTKCSASGGPRGRRMQLLVRSPQEGQQHQHENNVAPIAPLSNDSLGDIIWFIPPIMATTAFNLYEISSRAFHDTVAFLCQNTWIPVDGGKLQAELIIPAVNGPVLGSLSVLLATLTAITVSSLYTRQNEIRHCIVSNLEEIRSMGVMIQSLPEPYREKASNELSQFVDGLVEDYANGTLSPSSIRSRNMDEMLSILNDLSGETLQMSENAISDNILGACYTSISKIRSGRSDLICLIQATFPALHYVTLSVLASTICLVFLFETDQNVLMFLAGFQLKTLLWAVLVFLSFVYWRWLFMI